MNIIVDLWKYYCHLITLLSNYFRTTNIEGEFSERIASDFYGGNLAAPSTKGYDFDVNGTKYQVKSRIAYSKNNISGYLSDIHNWNFDYLIVILFNRNGTIKIAREYTLGQAKTMAKGSRNQISVSKIKASGYSRDITDPLKNKYNL